MIIDERIMLERRVTAGGETGSAAGWLVTNRR
jgi:hypothetical protein